MEIKNLYLKSDGKNYLGQKLSSRENIEIIKENVNIYDVDTNELLLMYRKNILDKDQGNIFYENIIEFAKKFKSSNRGLAGGECEKYSNGKKKRYGNSVMSTIIGYYDSFTPKQKTNYKKIELPFKIRECKFNKTFPEKFQKMIPFIKKIDSLYEYYLPERYNLQKIEADQTLFKIVDTSFTTVTINVNFQTNVHTDKGDFGKGFGNLVVIQQGNYSGGEFVLVQYGIGIDVRQGDILFMQSHAQHGNLPIILETQDAIRLSVVCYLRTNVVKNTRNCTKKEFESQLELLNSI
jgi:hypothetical protein